MKTFRKTTIKNMLLGFTLGAGFIIGLIFLISLMGFEIFPDESYIIGYFKDNNGKSFYLKNYPGNAITSSSISVYDSNDSHITTIITHTNYEKINRIEIMNDSTLIIELIAKKKSDKDTLFFVNGKFKDELNYISQYSNYMNETN